MLKLVVAQMRVNPVRLALTSLAIVAAAAAVAWVVSGYDALVAQFDENANRYLGRYDLLVTPSGGRPGAAATIDAAVIADLRADAGVLEVNPIAQSRVSVTPAEPAPDQPESSLGLLIGSKPPVNGAPPIGPALVATDAAEGAYEMVDGAWLSADPPQAPEAVLSRGAADSLGVGVGDAIAVTSIANQVRLQVVGVIEQAPQSPGGRRGGGGGRRGGNANQRQRPTGEGRRAGGAGGLRRESQPSSSMSIPGGGQSLLATNAVYVRFATAALVNGYEARPAVLQVALRDGYDVEAFRGVWDSRLAERRPPLRVVDFQAVRDGLAQGGSVSQKQAQAYSATGLAALAAVFIIFSTLSMGVSERSREFAMLRAVALTRGQIAAIIAVEAVVLAVVGWLGGLLAGWGILSIAAANAPRLFPNGAVVGWTCVWLTGACVGAGALGAAVLPAVQAMRIRPLDAFAKPTPDPPRRWLAACLAMGLVLILVAPASVFLVSMGDAARTTLYAAVSYPCLLIGMALVTPAVVVGVERFLAGPLAHLVRLDPLLLRGHLSSNLWRTLGATLALSSGLALYISTQTWGYSMLQPFLPGEWLPDAIVGFQPIGLDAEQTRQATATPGVAAGAMPLTLEQAKVAWPDGEVPRGMGKDNAVVIGVDPSEALGGESPLLPLRFVAGSRASAAVQIADRAGCLISEDYQMATGVGLGDTLRFTPPAAPDRTVEYQVVGVVAMPGWQWFTKFSGVRRHFVRAGGIVLADRDRVRRDFALGNRTEFLWLNFDGSRPRSEVEADLQTLAEASSGAEFQAGGVGQVTVYRPFARLTDTDVVRRGIAIRADGVIWGMSQLPLITLAITSLAVVNTVAASVRARTWELAILRSIGVTRGGLVRLVLAEAVLIGLAACLVSTAFGLIAGWCGVGMSRYSGAFFGGPPTFLVPWTHLGGAIAGTLSLCLAAAAWPAVRTGRAQPLSLLQAGRSAM